MTRGGRGGRPNPLHGQIETPRGRQSKAVLLQISVDPPRETIAPEMSTSASTHPPVGADIPDDELFKRPPKPDGTICCCDANLMFAATLPLIVLLCVNYQSVRSASSFSTTLAKMNTERIWHAAAT